MTDKELLEAAARAAGIEFRHDIDDFCTATKWVRCGLGDKEFPARYWNPLTDDGDALRLAVKLNMNVAVNYHNTCAETFHGKGTLVKHGLDPCSATRRAIVSAAAEIGSGHNAGGKPLSETKSD